MKKALFSILFLMPVLAMAQVATSPAPVASPAQVVATTVATVVTNPQPAWAPPQMVIDILNWVQNVPGVGPWVVKILMILATIATLMTVLATFLMGIKSSIQGIAKLAGLVTVIDAVENFYQKVAPYVQYLSMYNAKLPIGGSGTKPTV